ncbi:MAG: hypothetical protein HY428_01885 [Candidatus Levybacteria bacterium]|nr:hypothetical protein [Candidatus Levybacteria bacterium]
MRRYKFLQKEDIYTALNRSRDAFLAAKNGTEVEEIINGLLTHDERLKIGRRILIAQYLTAGIKFEDIAKQLKVGRNTIVSVMKSLDEHGDFLDLINKRAQKVEKEYEKRKYNLIGGSKLIHKRKEYSGFRRKDVER